MASIFINIPDHLAEKLVEHGPSHAQLIYASGENLLVIQVERVITATTPPKQITYYGYTYWVDKQQKSSPRD